MKRQTALNVVGVMSGTSADGIDVAVARVFPERHTPRLELLAFEACPFSRTLRAHVLASMDAPAASVADLSRLGTRLGIAYADAIEQTLRKHRLKADLAGCHGQTIYHQGRAAMFAGTKLATTWQLLDPSPVAERLRIPVVSDFRPADMAAGGQGAPLVPMFDYEFFRNRREHRVLLNLGGIGNMTVLRAGGSLQQVVAFDTGPANMVMDALMQRLFDKQMDRDGRTAARGTAIVSVVQRMLRAPFFSAAPPKSAGREQFGARYVEDFLDACRKSSPRDEDAVATAALLTARSVSIAVERFARPLVGAGEVSLVVSGGGARNPTLVRMIREATAALRCTVTSSDDLGMPGAAKEAAAFALLAWNTWHRLPGNVPSATGAARAVVLGRVSYV